MGKRVKIVDSRRWRGDRLRGVGGGGRVGLGGRIAHADLIADKGRVRDVIDVSVTIIIGI